MIGPRLSHFEILEEIGAGGMGVVYRARDLRLERVVALKILPEETTPPERTSSDSELRRRFLREARAASQLNHPNIVTVYEVDTDSGTDFIAMEYVEGRPLSTLLGDEPLALERTLSFATQIVDGLVCAHEHGIVHRDLKPQNIMITGDERAKILDFGLAKLVPTPVIGGDGETDDSPTARGSMPDLTTRGALLGTPRYMSPEQAKGDPVDTRSDIFSFGTILYEALAGRHPFPGAAAIEVIISILRDQPPRLSTLRPSLPPELGRIVERTLRKQPGERYQSARELAADLKALERGVTSGIVADSVQVLSRPRRRVWLPAVVLPAIVLAATLALWWPLRARQSPPVPLRFRPVSEVPTAAREVSFSGDGSMIAFAAEDDNGIPQIWVQALTRGAPVQITEGSLPAGSSVWSTRGDRVVFERQGQGIWSVPPLGGAEILLVPSGQNPHLSANGNRLVFEHRRRIWLADGDGSNPQVLDCIPASYFSLFSRHPALSPDGSEIAYFDPEDPRGDYWLVATESCELQRLTFDHGFGGQPAWTADGRWIVYSSNRHGSLTLWATSRSGGEPVAITSGAGEDTSPAISADGRRLAYTNTRTVYALVHLSVSTGERTRLLEGRSAIACPSISPRGDRIAVFAETEHGVHLFTVGIDGRELRQVTSRADEDNIVPRWSSDGDSLFYYRELPEPALCRVSAAGGESATVIDGWRWTVENAADISPDQQRIVYTLIEKGVPAESRVRDLTSGDERLLPVAMWFPRWSPDGTRVAGSDSSYDLVICSVAGGHCTRHGNGLRPLWTTAGTQICFLRWSRSEAAPGCTSAGIWCMPDHGGGEAWLIAQLDNLEILTFGFDVAANGDLVWSEVRRDRQELWLADLE